MRCLNREGLRAYRDQKDVLAYEYVHYFSNLNDNISNFQSFTFLLGRQVDLCPVICLLHSLQHGKASISFNQPWTG
jgi:hypothetical protein